MEAMEWMFINLVMANIDKRFPYVLAEIPDDKMNPENPIKYRLTFDPSRLSLSTSKQNEV